MKLDISELSWEPLNLQTQFVELTDKQWQFIKEILNEYKKRKPIMIHIERHIKQQPAIIFSRIFIQPSMQQVVLSISLSG